MRIPLALFAFIAALSAVACNLNRRDYHQTVSAAEQTSVFTDSAAHAQLCATNRPTED